MNIKTLFGFGTKSVDKSHIKNLTEMAKCDGHIAPQENDLLAVIAEENKIPMKAVEAIQKNLSNI